MNILGVSAGFHDAAISIVNPTGDILFAGHSERYSKIKNDPGLCWSLLQETLKYGPISTVAYYERPWLKQLRRLYSGEGVDLHKLTVRGTLKDQFNKCLKLPTDTRCYSHHLSHAAAGFQTSPYNRATVVVIDAVGEWDTISIWGAEYDSQGKAHYKKLWRQRYPHSIGLFYSAVTQRIGLHPLDEEYITMGMAAWGKTDYELCMEEAVVDDVWSIRFRDNLHTGLPENWMAELNNMDIAATAQAITEKLISNVMQRAKNFNWSTNLVYMGGVALNCLANRRLGEYFENIWIMPCPGDAGSSLGAAALAHGGRINFSTAYLGHDIQGPYPIASAIDFLICHGIVGVASGRAEFGPRALGNRSLLADPRGPEIKDRVNEIKRRQKFRPFAPVILEEHVDAYFDMPRGWSNSRYMQVVARCRRPDLFPAIVHVDRTSRVQTVPADGSGIRRLLEAWYNRTNCPMLLNTSLNIRGEPMVNDRADADRFQLRYDVMVVS